MRVHRRWAAFLLRAAVGVGTVVVLARSLGAGAAPVLRHVASIPLAVLLLALLIDVAGQSACAYRWWLLASSVAPSARLRRLWVLYFTGMFFGTCLPTVIAGDVVRIAGGADALGGRGRALASVVADRAIGLAALLVLAIPAAWTSGASLALGRSIAIPLWVAFAACAAGLAAMLVLVRFGNAPSDAAPTSLPSGRVRALVRTFRAQLAAPSRRALAQAFAVSLVYHASEAALVWVLALGLDLRITPMVALSAVALQAIAGVAPVTINNVGVREAALASVLLGVGPSLGPSALVAEKAFALASAWLGVIVASGAIGAVVYFASGLSRSRPWADATA